MYSCVGRVRELFGCGIEFFLYLFSLSIYIWTCHTLSKIPAGFSPFIWMHGTWIFFGICVEIFGIASLFTAHSAYSNFLSGRPPLTVVFQQTEKALMWLQMDIGLASIASSHWIMVSPSTPSRILLTTFSMAVLPVIAWASMYPKGAVGLTQFSSIFNVITCLHANLIVCNFWGIITSFLCALYILLASIPQHYKFFRVFRVESINIIYPALLTLAIIKGFIQLCLNRDSINSIT